MDTYYKYRSVKVMIAHKLMNMDGWKVYGYKPDESDSMIDYWNPANWGGIAEKNGYILCVNVSSAADKTEIKKYDYNRTETSAKVAEKIHKLEQMTVERGASEQEAETARKSIEKLMNKSQSTEKYVVTGYIPAHMANPTRMNWHIEKDGIIIAKGNGILKYAKVSNYYNYSQYKNDLKEFKAFSREEYTKKHAADLMRKWNYTEERAMKSAERHVEEMENDLELVNKFESLINKIDTACGGLLGEGDGYIYEKVTITKYKTENKVVEDETGSIKEGQLFVIKTGFNYGHNKGYVYRIHETRCEDGKVLYHANKLNRKKTKECTGRADSSNYWYITENFLRWFEKGSLVWCHLEEVKTPYEVEKVVKKKIKKEGNEKREKKTNKATTETKQTVKTKTDNQEIGSDTSDIENLHFEVSEDTDTRDNSKIYLAKVSEKLTREEYVKVNIYIKFIGGYYSRFKHAFLFKEDPSGKLFNVSYMEDGEKTEQEQKEENVKYVITEDKHTKTGAIIWIVKPEKNLTKPEFATIKKHLATLQGFYSSFKNGFIFTYDPTEKLCAEGG